LGIVHLVLGILTTTLSLSLALSVGCTEVEVVESGRKAIELIENRSFNLVLCDLHMPDIDGTGATPRRTHPLHQPLAL
jgi:CheY-like chemotaxis protein